MKFRKFARQKKFDKFVEELTQYISENSTNESKLLKMFVFFTDISKKSKYQTIIIETPILINKMKEISIHHQIKKYQTKSVK